MAARIESVLVDQREPANVVDQVHAALPDATVATALLDSGDAWIATSDGAMLVVERKTPSDLLSSIADGRLLAQASQMRGLSSWCYLVITGQLLPGSDGMVWNDRRPTRWNWDALQGALVSVQESGVAVLTCRSESEYGATLERLARRGRDVSRVPPSREIALASPGELVLAALPGVGPERVESLLRYCGTPALALVYLCGNGHGDPVPGIGPKTRAAARAALGLSEKTTLELMPIGENNDNVQTS